MRRFPTTLLFLVCFVSGSQWLLPWNDPSPASELLSLALGSVLALILLCMWKRRTVARTTELWNWKLVLAGIGSIGAPALLLLLGRQQYSSVMAVATQASVPVIVAITTGGTDSEGDLQKRLLPGLLALTGALLVLPVGLPQSSPGWSGLILYVVAACLSGIATVFSHREMIGMSDDSGVIHVVGANAMFLGVSMIIWLTVTAQWHFLRGVPVLSNLVFLLSMSVGVLGVAALLQALSPLAAASRFVFAPLIATVEAYVLLRPTLSLRTSFGALLMLMGGLACVQAEKEESASTTMSLR